MDICRLVRVEGNTHEFQERRQQNSRQGEAEYVDKQVVPQAPAGRGPHAGIAEKAEDEVDIAECQDEQGAFWHSADNREKDHGNT